MNSCPGAKPRSVVLAGFGLWAALIGTGVWLGMRLFADSGTVGRIIGILGVPTGIALAAFLFSERARHWRWRRPGGGAVVVGTVLALTVHVTDAVILFYVGALVGFFGAPLVKMLIDISTGLRQQSGRRVA